MNTQAFSDTFTDHTNVVNGINLHYVKQLYLSWFYHHYARQCHAISASGEEQPFVLTQHLLNFFAEDTEENVIATNQPMSLDSL